MSWGGLVRLLQRWYGGSIWVLWQGVWRFYGRDCRMRSLMSCPYSKLRLCNEGMTWARVAPSMTQACIAPGRCQLFSCSYERH